MEEGVEEIFLLWKNKMMKKLLREEQRKDGVEVVEVEVKTDETPYSRH